MAKRICLNCGSDNHYAKNLCRNCYHRYLRANCKTSDEFVEYEKNKNELSQKKSKIKAIISVVRFNYADIGRKCGVTREFVRQWFSPAYKIPDKYVDDVFNYISEHVSEALNILKDFS